MQLLVIYIFITHLHFLGVKAETDDNKNNHDQNQNLRSLIQAKANRILESWSLLQDTKFKIPKTYRAAQKNDKIAPKKLEADGLNITKEINVGIQNDFQEIECDFCGVLLTDLEGHDCINEKNNEENDAEEESTNIKVRILKKGYIY